MHFSDAPYIFRGCYPLCVHTIIFASNDIFMDFSFLFVTFEHSACLQLLCSRQSFLICFISFQFAPIFSIRLWFICNFMCCMYVQFYFSFTFGVVQHYCDFQQSGGTRFIHCCAIYTREYEKCKKLRQNMKIELVFVFTFMFYSPCPIHPPLHLFSHHLREMNSQLNVKYGAYRRK